jgi:hypothetical protein
VRCLAQCGLYGVAKNEGCKARDARGSRFPGGGVVFRKIGDDGSKGERDVRRCPPTLHGLAHSCRGVKGRDARQMREGTRPCCTVGYRLLTRRAGRGGLSSGRDRGKSAPAAPYIAKKSRFLFSRLLRWLGKFAGEGREFAGVESKGRGVSPIVCARVASVGRRAPAFQRGPIPGPSASQNAVEVSFAWVRGRDVRYGKGVREIVDGLRCAWVRERKERSGTLVGRG